MKSHMNRLRVSIFDIDQNLTTKDIPVVLQKGDKIEEFISVDWRKYMDDGYTFVNDNSEESFIYGRDTGKDGGDTFPKYIQGVLDENALGPSFPKFKEAIIHANPFGENTSRGHSVSNIITGTKMLILGTMKPLELEQTHESIYKRGWNTQTALIDALDDYLGQQIYAPMHNPEFLQKCKIDISVPYHEKKARAMEYIVAHVSDLYKRYFAKTNNGISIGFSDDDEYNIKAVNEWGLQHREWLHCQNIHFTTYHTSNTNTTKRKITDKSKMNTMI